MNVAVKLFTLGFLQDASIFKWLITVQSIMEKKVDQANQLSDEWKKANQEVMKRSKAKNNSAGTQNNIRKNSIYIGLEFQLLGTNDPAEINQNDFLNWLDGLRQGTLGTKKLGSTTIKKRVETLRAILQACKLSEQLDFVDLWKPDTEVKEITYWSVDELDAMDDRALFMFQNEELRPRAMAHIIHSMMAPRISDVAAFRWDYFDFQTMTIQFRAKKNKKRCFQYIQPNLVHTIQEYQSWVSQFTGGNEYLFPTSILSPSGTTKHDNLHASDKTIRKWLKHVRDSTTVHGKPIQPLPSHSYRRSLAMRYLTSGSTFENIAMVLGDEIGTLEKHYAELIPNDSQRLAFEKAFRKSAWISSKGTVQPEWLKRPRGSNSNFAMRSSPTNNGFGLDMGSGRTRIRTRVSSLEG
jgi:site-specific recombinase XerD